MNPGRDGGGARLLGYFPDDAIERVRAILRMKREGAFMSDIVERLQGGANTAPARAVVDPPPRAEREPAATLELHLSIDQIPHPAYMVNYNFEVV